MEINPPGPDDREQAILRELQSLQQALSHLVDVERRLQGEQQAIHQAINAASRQAYQAQQANQPDQLTSAMDQRARAMAAGASLEDQLQRISARKQDIATHQQRLQAELVSLQSSQRLADLRLQGLLAAAPAPAPAYTSTPAYAPGPAAPGLPRSIQRRTGRRRAVWLLGLTAVLLVLSSLGLVWYLKQSSPVQSTLTPIKLSTDNQPFYQATGNLPTDQYCLSHLHVSCLSPEAIQQAFRLNPLYRSGIDGKDQTIVLLGAGHTTTLQADVHHFDQTWGLPDPSLTIKQTHGPPAPYTCPGGVDLLEGESTLDVEWSHAIAPGAKIVLLIGSNQVGLQPRENCSGDLTLLQDVNDAINQHLGQIISMSLGGSELGFDTDTAADAANRQEYFDQGDEVFQQAVTDHVTVIASAGDDGVTNPDDPNNPASYWNKPNVSWPASDPNVLAVGGTLLSLDASNDYQSEVVWNDQLGATGGGRSAISAEPDYQKHVPDQSLFHDDRGVPDVAFPADGFLVYDSSGGAGLGQVNSEWNHWQVVGGTSASAPSWAGFMALANQLRGQPLGFIQPLLYALQGKGMHDVTSGNNSLHSVTGFSAQKGFDLVSGWGTPIADQFIPDLVEASLQGG